jgi:hypothetical protein
MADKTTPIDADVISIPDQAPGDTMEPTHVLRVLRYTTPAGLRDFKIQRLWGSRFSGKQKWLNIQEADILDLDQIEDVKPGTIIEFERP